MAWYKRLSRFMVDAFRLHNLKTTAAPRIPLQKSFSTITFSHRSSSSNSRISGCCQPLLRSFVSQNAPKNRQCYKSPFLDGSKRFFHSVGTNNKVLEHFKPKGFKFWTCLLGCGVVISSYYWNLERVPYTKRSHFVLFSTSLEKEFGEIVSLKRIKSEYEGKILPPLHPWSIRVQRIGQEIVEAAQKGLRKEEESLIIKKLKKLGKRDSHQIPQFEWEFVVVDKPIREAESYPGGKVVLFTGWFVSCKSDAEFAAIIGHEVGHAIARHYTEDVSRLPGMIILMLFIYWNINLHLVPAMSKFLARLPYSRRQFADTVSRLRSPRILKFFLYLTANLSLIPALSKLSKFLISLPYSRRQEKEADYIGLILVALAGYDPRVVVELLENYGDYSSHRPFEDYLHTHPSGKKRAQLLSQPKVMEEALSLYREREVSMQCFRDAKKSNIVGSVRDSYANCGIRIRKF